jgi:hypothetical protein
LAVGILAVCAPAIAHAAPRPYNSYELRDTMVSSMWGDSPLKTSQWFEPHAFEDATDVPGAPRTPWRVVRVPPGGGLDAWPLTPGAYRSWTVALLVSLADVSGPARVLTHDTVRDEGLYVEDGHLVFRGSGVAPGSTELTADSWHQIVVSRDDADDMVRVLVDGEPEFQFEDTAGIAVYDARRRDNPQVRVFSDELPGFSYGTDAKEHAHGRVGRVRAWKTALSADDAASLDWIDATPPSISLRSPADGEVTAGRPTFYGSGVSDDVTIYPRISATVRDAAGTKVAVATGHVPFNNPPETWRADWPGHAPELAHGARYTVEITATDAAGNEAALTRWFTVDARHTGRLTLTEQPGAETYETAVRVAGRIATETGDAPFVQVVVGTSCVSRMSTVITRR